MKAILIISVVFGHSLEFLCGVKEIYGAIRAMIYAFHMPAFVFLSGFFAKQSKSSIQKVIIKYGFTYLLFNTLFALTPFRITSPLNFLYPQLVYWYLMSLCIWRITIPVLDEIRYMLPLSVLASLYIGYCPAADRFLALSRTICFFPFFLAGYRADLNKHTDNNHWLVLLCLFMCFVITIVVNRLNIVPVKMYEYIQSYSSTGVGSASGILMRIFMMTISFAIIPCLYILMPSRPSVFTVLGTNSMMIYVNHIFIIKLINHFFPLKKGNPLFNIAFCSIITIIICFLLSLPIITKAYSKITDHVVKTFAVDDR